MIYPCPECPTISLSSADRDQHRNAVHLKERLDCDASDVDTALMTLMRRLKIDGKAGLENEFLGVAKTWPVGYSLPMQLTADQHILQCQQCLHRCTDEEDMKQHLTTVHPDGQRHCGRCLTSFALRADYLKHVVDCSPDLGRRCNGRSSGHVCSSHDPCPFCRKYCCRPHGINRPADQPAMQRCKVCRGFNRNPELHVLRVHPKRPTQKCAGCGEAFATTLQLAEHEKTASEGLFGCQYCTHAFDDGYDLLYHRDRMHRMKCPEHRFEVMHTEAELYEHLVNEHERLEVRCSICETSAANWYDMCHHQRATGANKFEFYKLC